MHVAIGRRLNPVTHRNAGALAQGFGLAIFVDQARTADQQADLAHRLGGLSPQRR